MKGRCDDTSPLATSKCRAIHRISPRYTGDELQFTPQPQLEHFRPILGLMGSLLVPPNVSRLLSVTARAADAADAARGDAAMPQDALHVVTMSREGTILCEGSELVCTSRSTPTRNDVRRVPATPYCPLIPQ